MTDRPMPQVMHGTLVAARTDDRSEGLITFLPHALAVRLDWEDLGHLAAELTRHYLITRDLIAPDHVASYVRTLQEHRYFTLLADQAAKSIEEAFQQSALDPDSAATGWVAQVPAAIRRQVAARAHMLSAGDQTVVQQASLDLFTEAIRQHALAMMDEVTGWEFQREISHQVLATGIAYARYEDGMSETSRDLQLPPSYAQRPESFLTRARYALFNPVAYKIARAVGGNATVDDAILDDLVAGLVTEALTHTGLISEVSEPVGDVEHLAEDADEAAIEALNRHRPVFHQLPGGAPEHAIARLPSSRRVQSFTKSGVSIKDWEPNREGRPYHGDGDIGWGVGGPLSPSDVRQRLVEVAKATNDLMFVRLGLCLMMFHAAQSQFRAGQTEMRDVTITVNQIMHLLKFSRSTRRSFDTPQKRAVVECFRILSWLELHDKEVDSFEVVGSGKRRREERVKRRMVYPFITTDARSEVSADGQNRVPTHFRYKPGPWAADYNGELGSPQLGLIMQGVLQKKGTYAFLLGTHLCFQWRMRYFEKNYKQPFRVGTLLEDAGLEPNGKTATRNPAMYRKTVEKALRELKDDGSIGPWRYRSQPELPGRKDWFPVWLSWTIEILPPEPFLGKKAGQLYSASGPDDFTQAALL